jgi:abortive infection bacteriophage resistance protein
MITENEKRYDKPPLTAAAQVDKLKQRGLVIGDPEHAEAFFRSNSYYRFSAYTYVFEDSSGSPSKRSHTYRASRVTFEQIYRLYTFDQSLREITSRALRPIEVGTRTRICLDLSVAHKDGHFYLHPRNFKKAKDHTDFLALCCKEVGKSKETFIEHYKGHYDIPVLPPLWMMIEILTFGQISMFFNNLTAANQKIVSATLDLPTDTLASWLSCLSYTRNLCFHHCRLWNRRLTKDAKRSAKLPGTTKDATFARAASVIKYLLDKLEIASDFVDELKTLLSKYPEIDPSKLGFQGLKLVDPFWNA